MSGGSVLTVGLDPSCADFADMPGLNPAIVRAYIDAQIEGMRAAGYAVESCLVGADDQAHRLVEKALRARKFDCVVVGNGLRSPPAQLLLFERIVNAVHELAPNSRIAFNSNPADTMDAVRRWIG
jgi:hypothetical protein